MTKINPVGVLNSKAQSMVMSLVNNSPNKDQYVGEFFKLANKYDLQGPALVSYYSALHNLENSSSTRKAPCSIPNVRKYIVDILTKEQTETADVSVPKIGESVKEEADIFADKLNKMYHKNLRARISLADQGAVNTSTALKKTPLITKMLVRANLLIDKLITKIEPISQKLYEFCKPVE